MKDETEAGAFPRAFIILILCVSLWGPATAQDEAEEPEPADARQPGRVVYGTGDPQLPEDFLPLEDRWRIGFPDWHRYAHGRRRAPYKPGAWYDPYNQNTLKGDYPILGDATFLNLTLLSDTIVDFRRVPVPSGISAQAQGNENFFGDGDQFAGATNLLLSVDLFHGAAAFRPVDWRIRVTPVFNVNYLDVEERGLVNIDVRRGVTRTDRHIGFQEGFVEAKLADLTATYDVLSLRLGIQGFLSDFRGFIFADNEAGARLTGAWASNRSQWNLAWFKMIEKETNSLLNTNDFQEREQEVFIANLFRQDFIWPGYNASLSYHLNMDGPSVHYDKNGFLVRPGLAGQALPHDVEAHYVGWTGQGHIGRVNISHALYRVTGDDSRNPISDSFQEIRALMGALELSVDYDWYRYRVQGFYASGDRDPRDRKATGFDAVFDNPFFAGAESSYWVRQAIPLTGTKLRLVSEASLLPSLRSSKDEGQANFINPGLLLFGAGIDADLTPKVKLIVNANWIQFDDTSSLEFVLFQNRIDKQIGTDAGLAFQWRPWLNNNVIFTLAGSTLFTDQGFEDIYPGEELYTVDLSMTLVY